MKTKLAYLFILIGFLVQAQDKLWYTSVYMGTLTMEFSDDGSDPLVEFVSVLDFEGLSDTYESAVTLSNFDNELILYSNGVNLYDRSKKITPNGVGLIGPAESSASTAGSNPQGALLVNKPGNDNQFYLITAGDVNSFERNGIRYNLIDLSLPGNGTIEDPYGDIVEGKKNIVLVDGETKDNIEAMTVFAKNCDTTWLVTHELKSDTFNVFPITREGIGEPIISKIGPKIVDGNMDDGRGQMAFNSDGSKLALATKLYTAIFDFDVTTGKVVNEKEIESYGSYACAWSSNDSCVYFSYLFGGGSFRVYYPHSDKLENPEIGVDGNLRRAPNGKIYIKSNLVSSFSILENPNELDYTKLNVTTIPYSTYSGASMGRLGLQNIYISPYYGKVSECDSVKIFLEEDKETIELTESPFMLTATPAGGVWFIDGEEVSSGYIDPSALGLGLHDVTYTITDKETSAEYSDEVEIVVVTSFSTYDLAQNSNFKLFPNPTGDFTTLNYDVAENAELTLTVKDINGRVYSTQIINAQKGELSFQLDTKYLNSGIYFVTLNSNETSIGGKLIVK